MSLTSKGHFKVGSTEFVAKSIKLLLESIASEDSGRTDDGVMHIGNWIKRKLRKWEIEMPPCDSQAAFNILSVVQGQEYNLTIWDVSSNSEQTVAVYTSNSSGDCYSGVIQNGLWQGIAFSAIEVG